jgi:hypothetical protein
MASTVSTHSETKPGGTEVGIMYLFDVDIGLMFIVIFLSVQLSIVFWHVGVECVYRYIRRYVIDRENRR